jgi:ABC-type amino acid transport substrate-binding protein
MKTAEGRWTGLNTELWYQIANDLKISYEFKEMPFGKILEALKNKEIDFSVASLYMTMEREKAFDFSIPVGETRLAIATTRELHAHPWWGAVHVFMSWNIILIISIFLFLLLFLGIVFWAIEQKSNPEHFGGGFRKGFWSGVYWVGATLASGVCFGVSLKTAAGRMIGICWMLICTLAISALTASLASTLTARSLDERLAKPEQLRRMHLGVIRETHPADIISGLGGKVMFFDEEDEALKTLTDAKLDGVVLDEITLQYYEETKYRNRIFINPTDLRRESIAFGMPLGSPLRKPVNIAMLKIMNDPVWESMLQRYGLKKNFESLHVVTGHASRRKKT